ncbi:MAG: Protein translocase subunit SecF [Parcubacteria group bacterium GW2011_GWA1_33_6]|uniref:Protein-export membrane protein SecF n=1 Tax=Candidatus Staskawiczbacteria bacterium RIFCSPHIGHO2_02_FULL_33_16 TaxID=1802204 RepID=A0A1G2HSS2_9BACT|nr:MAG: Protein translocase subunit SecF [Parcubacteria group bacterium GW2011_GWA2_33_14]KKP54381.1 MAG: Protein translocase subunit SecF [Parcubacteria group bacterium GW2011_GWA1_33_6]OGZ65475.1 MAG: protein-export membrane protein SecF [Candidatus Staskawiczbacteria bacterium RIFCSPHIGHO2_02_FULL_33_16]OGZ69992.1 MAG: protein-export membrane protein SecF [Candidatus Staskawiczbacteria bacterium RIFCSPLOWO2_01_FULL_33_13]
MFPFTKYSKIYYIFSGFLIVVSVASLIFFGLKFGIEFTGGSNMEIEFNPPAGGQRPSNEEISNSLLEFDLGEIIVQPTGNNGAVLRFKGVDEAQHQQILSKLNESFLVQENNFQYIGPSVGNELKNKTLISISLALLVITLYIAFAFRKVSKPVSSWKYGVTSLIALFHDIIIPLGVFSVLGKFYHIEITVPIIAALLTIIGFSVHDTIVIFDRIRENILRKGNNEFRQTIDLSLNQTVGRSISTVFTVLIVMFALFFFGGITLKYFSLALIIGIAAGTYSSIFIASSLLITWKEWDDRRLLKKG